MSRRCVFCGGVPLTREHVIPRWLTQVLPEQAPFRGQDQALVMRPLDGDASILHLPHREAPEAFNAATVKVVCARCNNGWMNAIEESARQPLSALVRGEPRTLTRADLAAVAAWTVKTCLTVQLTGTRTAAALDAIYRDFSTVQKPPANAVVWAGAIDAEDWALRAEAVSVLVVEEGDGLTIDDPPNTLAVTLGLGRLLLNTVVTTRPKVSSPPHDRIAPGTVVRFWPDPQLTEWPPVHQVIDEQAWWIARSLADWLSND